jgi:hypothetical protein
LDASLSVVVNQRDYPFSLGEASPYPELEVNFRPLCVSEPLKWYKGARKHAIKLLKRKNRRPGLILPVISGNQVI